MGIRTLVPVAAVRTALRRARAGLPKVGKAKAGKTDKPGKTVKPNQTAEAVKTVKISESSVIGHLTLDRESDETRDEWARRIDQQTAALHAEHEARKQYDAHRAARAAEMKRVRAIARLGFFKLSEREREARLADAKKSMIKEWRQKYWYRLALQPPTFSETAIKDRGVREYFEEITKSNPNLKGGRSVYWNERKAAREVGREKLDATQSPLFGYTDSKSERITGADLETEFRKMWKLFKAAALTERDLVMCQKDVVTLLVEQYWNNKIRHWDAMDKEHYIKKYPNRDPDARVAQRWVARMTKKRMRKWFRAMTDDKIVRNAAISMARVRFCEWCAQNDSILAPSV